MQMSIVKYSQQIKRVPQVESGQPKKIKINRCLWLRACYLLFVLFMFHSPDLVFMNNDLHPFLLIVQVRLHCPCPSAGRIYYYNGFTAYQHSNNSLQMFLGFHGCCSGSRWGSGRKGGRGGEQQPKYWRETDRSNMCGYGGTKATWHIVVIKHLCSSIEMFYDDTLLCLSVPCHSLACGTDCNTQTYRSICAY